MIFRNGLRFDFNAQLVHARRNRARTHENYFLARVVQVGYFTNQMFDSVKIQFAGIGVCQRTRTNLDDDSPRSFQFLSCVTQTHHVPFGFHYKFIRRFTQEKYALYFFSGAVYD